MEREPRIEFRIRGYTPATLPLQRLAEYLLQLAALYGPAGVHFDRVLKGSAVLVSRVDRAEVSRVVQRLSSVKRGGADESAQRAYARINDMLVTNQASATITTKADGKVLEFPGIRAGAPRIVTIEDFAEVEGIVIRVGGKDRTIPVHVQALDGTIYPCQVMDKALAREFAAKLYGEPVRVAGYGTWERGQDETWTLQSMTITTWQTLDEDPLDEVFTKARAIPGNGWRDVPDIRKETDKLRSGS